jgi:hypothetical protein
MLAPRAPWAVVTCLLFFVAGCTCGKTPIVQKDQCLGVSGAQADRTDPCTDNTDCASHFGCKEPKDKAGVTCCIFVDRACSTEADCCEGQTCPADRKKCFDKFIACEKDADCGDKGDSVCEVYTDTYGTSSRCRHKACGSLGECPDGQGCFQGECIAGLPCDGTCAAGTACVPSVNRCQDYSHPTDRTTAACPMTCNPGYIGTFKDNRNLWDSCDLAAVQCVCAELPGLASNDLGRFSAVAADPGKALYVSAYDGQYGDLVVARYGLDGKRLGLDYVDGVPAGQVKYGPSGARGGIVDPGNDVGRYTDVAVGNGQVFVSYYDVTNGDLKFASRSADGKWSNHKVDGSTGNVGLYSSIALDGAGNPAIAYFQKGGDSGFNVSDCPAPAPTGPTKYITALKFAHATKAVPTSAGDWSVKTVACMDSPAPTCDGCTGICGDPGSGPACYTAASGCTGCDPNTQACVTVGSTPTCANKYNPSTLVDVPVGVGVFPSLAFNGTDGYIAYMKRNAPASTKSAATGELWGVRIASGDAVQAPVKLDATGDTGFFPDLKVDPSTHAIDIAYHDFSSRSLKLYSSASLQTGVTPELIDNGIDTAAPGNQSWVGTDSALVFSGSALYAVYQDPTKGDLKLAKRGSSSWTVQTSIATDGAVGFFADGVFTDGKLYASHAKIHAKLVSGEPTVDNTLKLELVTPP